MAVSTCIQGCSRSGECARCIAIVEVLHSTSGRSLQRLSAKQTQKGGPPCVTSGATRLTKTREPAPSRNQAII